jgi:KDO2-lipid IV(A) lauroyltransferase
MKMTLTTRTILCAFGSIPFTLRKTLFRAGFILFYHLSPKHRVIVLQNLINAFPEKTEAEIGRIAKNVYLNLGTTAAEFFVIPTLTKENMSDWVTFDGLDNYERARSKGKGILFYTAHFGNWEMLAACVGLQGIIVTIIYRALDNPVLEDFVAWFRSFTGHKILPKGGAAGTITERLRHNEMIGVLIDQNVSWREGVFIDFFGRPASTTKRFADIALRTGAPVMVGFSIRQPDGRYRLVFPEDVEIIRTGDHEKDLFENTQKFTRIIEDVVRKYPDQYFWLHQRWKTKKNQVVT